MMRCYIIWAIIIVSGCGFCYVLGQLSQMKDNLKVIDLYYEMAEDYEKRIRLMRDFIEYNEDVVNNAMGMTAKKWMEHIEKQYIKKQYEIWDDGYEEEYDDFCRDD